MNGPEVSWKKRCRALDTCVDNWELGLRGICDWGAEVFEEFQDVARPLEGSYETATRAGT